MKLTPEAEAVLARAVFDETAAREESYRIDDAISAAQAEDYIDNYSFILGAKWENARLLPIITKLLEDNCRLIQSIQEEIENHSCSCQTMELLDGGTEKFTCHFHYALTAHAELMKELAK